MAVSDYIKPVTDHRTGIPSMIVAILKHLRPNEDRRVLRPVREAYEKQVRLIEMTLDGKDYTGIPIPLDREELAAELVSHLIIDCAFLHDRLMYAGVDVGEFPFDKYADIILPNKEKKDA